MGNNLKTQNLSYKLQVTGYKQRAFSLVEVLIGTSLVLIVFMGLFGLYQMGLKVLTQSRVRIVATAIANQKIEEIKNLSYSDIRYSPEGEILRIENSPDDKYIISTTIIPVIDCFDGPTNPGSSECVDAPAVDDCEIDYKRIKVEVSQGFSNEGKVWLTTDVVPKTLAQECEEEKGKIFVSVIDANSESVSFPRIEIIDLQTGAVIAVQQPLDGNYDFALFSEQAYKIKVSAFGYEEQTYGEGETYFINGQEIIIKEPEKEHLWLGTDESLSIGFQMDELGSIEVQTVSVEEEFPIIAGIDFTIWGTKLIGEDFDGDPIYKYIQNDISDSEGKRILSDLEFDSYYFSIDSEEYTSIEVDPSQPADLLPGENKIVRLILGQESSLLVTVLDSSTSDPIFGAKVRLWKDGYNEKKPTDEYGRSFFTPLESETYNLRVKDKKYLTFEGEISISEGQDKEVTIELIKK